MQSIIFGFRPADGIGPVGITHMGSIFNLVTDKLRCFLIITANAAIGSDPHIAIRIFKHITYFVVRQRILAAILLIPYGFPAQFIHLNKPVGTAQP